MHTAVRNVMRLFDRIKDYEKRVLARRGAFVQPDMDALLEALRLLVQVLAPFTPHLAEELWVACGEQEGVMPWPVVSFRVPA